MNNFIKLFETVIKVKLESFLISEKKNFAQPVRFSNGEINIHQQSTFIRQKTTRVESYMRIFFNSNVFL